MSLYNSLFGENNLAPVLKSVLKLDTENYPTGRYRDIYLDGDKITLYTRNGGGNREDYQFVFDALSKHPNYIRNYDDDFDCTYAYVEFSIPDQFKEKLLAASEQQGEVLSPTDRFQKLISDLRTGNQTPETDKAVNVGKDVFGKIQEAFDKGENKIIEI